VTDEFFSGVPDRIPFGGLDSTDPLAFKVYEPDRSVLGRRMEDHLRIGVCLWHSFAWDGRDMFGIGTLDRPWLDPAAEPMPAARRKMAVAFEFIEKLGMPWYCFHDRDVAPEGTSFAEFRDNLDALTDDALGYQERTGARLLWGTANLFTHPRYQGGAATNPDPEVFAYAAAQVKHMLEVTQRLGGTNYVLWGGREGYDTLLNTDLKREGDQLARFLHLVADHKHRIGFDGTLLIEPKPMEPTKHQYDYDSATIHGFLVRNGLEDEYRLNIEANHVFVCGGAIQTPALLHRSGFRGQIVATGDRWRFYRDNGAVACDPPRRIRYRLVCRLPGDRGPLRLTGADRDLLVGATGVYIIQEADLWGRFSLLTYWWMHAMVGVWAIFAIGLFLVEPFILDRHLARFAVRRPAATFAWQNRVHWLLLALSLITVCGAVAGSHGWLIF